MYDYGFHCPKRALVASANDVIKKGTRNKTLSFSSTWRGATDDSIHGSTGFRSKCSFFSTPPVTSVDKDWFVLRAHNSFSCSSLQNKKQNSIWFLMKHLKLRLNSYKNLVPQNSVLEFQLHKDLQLKR